MGINTQKNEVEYFTLTINKIELQMDREPDTLKLLEGEGVHINLEVQDEGS